MATNFQLFGPIHLAILASIPAIAFALARWSRGSADAARTIRMALGVFLLINETVWWIYRIRHEGLRFPGGLPLQLCDFALWLTILALLTLSRWAYEVAYYAGLAGASMAALTPELWAPFPSYPTTYFFLEHGGAIIGVLTLTWGKLARPRPGGIWRALLMLNAYAAAVGVFNAVFGANYMYLCRKPVSASLLDYLGPWPVYLVSAEALGIALFGLLWLPFRDRKAPRAI
ncbi:MAG: TIGR02206 family membrane protein [Bryobacteraceae bacterium]